MQGCNGDASTRAHVFPGAVHAGRPNAFRSLSELLAHPQVAALLAAPVASSSSSGANCNGASRGQRQPEAARPKLAFVFGREVEGLLPAEVDACNFTLSIPIGRLQGVHGAAGAQQAADKEHGMWERVWDLTAPAGPPWACSNPLHLAPPAPSAAESMSLSHAVSVVLSRLFEQRQQAAGFDLPQGVADLAAGWEDSGVER